ncbi:hypothetical protein [Pseudobacteroides cellulosolvens]|uniref:Uncharacterized protein n=1 Tax=Pseudobacteroides cellulosolvens ATCC 35603 = DSM 2933 TaxID=398512 RepID=A0A0L6JRB5_9FIRM|nr:hypothetical protein [Pseudobacteroides cellulosolvens]KNY28323.1 hypothetical protein Bccel_3597 [Pseudobacteroides cellulosolvens ATCC 35603 = DSM 2933]
MNIRFVKIISTVVILMISFSLFAACGISIRSNQNSANKHMSSSFKKLSKEFTKEIELIQDQTLTVTYDIKVISGSLNVKFVDPKGTEIIAFDKTQNGMKDIKIDQSGTYKIIVIGKDAEGSYDLRWETL